MTRQSGILLLSALRKHKSKSAVIETPDAFFDEGEERNAFHWLRDYVSTHNAFPTAGTFERETGITATLVAEPLSYYMDDARKKTLFESLFQPYKRITEMMTAKNPDGVLEVMSRVQTAANALNHHRSGVTTFAQSMRLIEMDYDEARRASGDLRGIPTGWDFTDRVTDGYQHSQVITVVGRPKRGKTQILLKKLHAAHSAGYSALFFSGEMGSLQLARRYYGIHTGINPRFLRRGELSSYQQTEFFRNLNIMAEDETPLHWLAGDFKQTLPALEAAVSESEPDIIFTDAGYLLRPDKAKNSRREDIASVIEGIGEISRKFQRPVVLSVQFNRQAIRPKRGEDDSDRSNPIGHLILEKIGESDTVGQVSSMVYGIELGDTPNERDERYMGFLAGREGEEGWMKINYKFQPVDLSEITNSNRAQQDSGERTDLTFMDQAV